MKSQVPTDSFEDLPRYLHTGSFSRPCWFSRWYLDSELFSQTPIPWFLCIKSFKKAFADCG